MTSAVSPPGSGRALAVVSTAVLLGSSTWLAATAVVPAVTRAWHLQPGEAAWLTSSVQLGFIVGTLLYAMLNLADRYSERHVFFVSALLGATANAAFGFLADDLPTALIYRFATGVTLAGIYPVGMKMVAARSPAGLGHGLGIMVGALVLGSSLPYLIAGLGTDLPWRSLVGTSSILAVVGGLLVLLALGDGPSRPAARFDARMMFKVFRDRDFRLNAFGYFGHMWELYAFWSVSAAFLGSTAATVEWSGENISLLVFFVVATGAVGCAVGGFVSRRIGERRVALYSLLVSATACLFSPAIFTLPVVPLVVVALIWGFAVVADSPQFSALAAVHAPREYVGTALTIQNGIGFALTIITIQLVPALAGVVGWQWAVMVLAPGPLLGALAMTRVSER